MNNGFRLYESGAKVSLICQKVKCVNKLVLKKDKFWWLLSSERNKKKVW
jgi:hypothetical protein